MLGSRWTWMWSVWDITRWFVVFFVLGWMFGRFLFLGGMRVRGQSFGGLFRVKVPGFAVLRNSLISPMNQGTCIAIMDSNGSSCNARVDGVTSFALVIRFIIDSRGREYCLKINLNDKERSEPHVAIADNLHPRPGSMPYNLKEGVIAARTSQPSQPPKNKAIPD
jgi:hypothetical protein